MNQQPPEEPTQQQIDDAIRREMELLAGCQFQVAEDPTDARFSILTFRHPKIEQVDGGAPALHEPRKDGELAQIAMVAFAIAVVAQQGIMPGHIAMQLIEQLAKEAERVARGTDAPRIILPGGH